MIAAKTFNGKVPDLKVKICSECKEQSLYLLTTKSQLTDTSSTSDFNSA